MSPGDMGFAIGKVLNDSGFQTSREPDPTANTVLQVLARQASRKK